MLGRQDTLSQARQFLHDHYAPELRVTIEPAVPGRYFRSNPQGRIPSWLTRCPQRPGWTDRGWSYLAANGQRVCDRYKPALFARADGGVRASAFHAVLRPSVIDDYRLYGYCLVMTVNVVRDRALETGDPRRAPTTRGSTASPTCCASSAPTSEGAKPVPFSFDLSYNYYPTAYERPGPDGRHPPPARLHAGVRRAADPHPEGRRAGALLLAR